MITLFGKRIRLFRPKSIWIRKSPVGILCPDRSDLGQPRSGGKRWGKHPVFGQRSLHAVCPFGGVVTIYQFATVGHLCKSHQASLC